MFGQEVWTEMRHSLHSSRTNLYEELTTTACIQNKLYWYGHLQHREYGKEWTNPPILNTRQVWWKWKYYWPILTAINTMCAGSSTSSSILGHSSCHLFDTGITEFRGFWWQDQAAAHAKHHKGAMWVLVVSELLSTDKWFHVAGLSRPRITMNIWKCLLAIKNK